MRPWGLQPGGGISPRMAHTQMKISILPPFWSETPLNQWSVGVRTKKVLAQHRQGLSYRLIGRNLGLSKNTVMEMVRRAAS